MEDPIMQKIMVSAATALLFVLAGAGARYLRKRGKTDLDMAMEDYEAALVKEVAAKQTPDPTDDAAAAAVVAAAKRALSRVKNKVDLLESLAEEVESIEPGSARLLLERLKTQSKEGAS